MWSGAKGRLCAHGRSGVYRCLRHARTIISPGAWASTIGHRGCMTFYELMIQDTSLMQQNFPTKTEHAYCVLRRVIVTGGFDDGAPLDEVELMSRFDVGRTPIREAIKRLAGEEFSIWHPHRTPHVRSTSADDLASLFEARHFFEIPAVRFAAQRGTPAELELMEQVCRD